MPRGPVKSRKAYADPRSTPAGKRHNEERAYWLRLWVESADGVGFPVDGVDRERVREAK